jgi:hypothetical protein
MKLIVTKTVKLLVKKFASLWVKECRPGPIPGAYCPDPYGFVPFSANFPEPDGFLPWTDETCDPPEVDDPPEPPNPPHC